MRYAKVLTWVTAQAAGATRCGGGHNTMWQWALNSHTYGETGGILGGGSLRWNIGGEYFWTGGGPWNLVIRFSRVGLETYVLNRHSRIPEAQSQEDKYGIPPV